MDIVRELFWRRDAARGFEEARAGSAAGVRKADAVAQNETQMRRSFIWWIFFSAL